MGGVFVVVGPVPGEDLVGLAAEQEVEVLLEDAVELFAELSIEVGHRPAAELEALGRILGRPAGRLHDAIDGNLGADDNLPHGSLSLFEAQDERPASDPMCSHINVLASGAVCTASEIRSSIRFRARMIEAAAFVQMKGVGSSFQCAMYASMCPPPVCGATKSCRQ